MKDYTKIKNFTELPLEVTIREITEDVEVLNRCRVTVWKDALEKQPTTTFLDNIYKSEHSPIRDKWFTISIKGIPSWLATHFVRHHIGYTPYVSTQRDDRIDYDTTRGERAQGELVNMDITLNAQAFINVSRKRLCGMAHDWAMLLWEVIVTKLAVLAPELANNCVAECVYRGFCPELKCCGLIGTKQFKAQRELYIGNRPSFRR